VIRNVDVTEAEVFGCLHEIADNVEISANFSLWKMNADLHRSFRLWIECGSGL
jgi:hypothetical protein